MRSGEELREEFRAAVASGEYARAGGAWADLYCLLLGTLGEAGSAQQLEQARELLEWTRHTVAAGRALAMDELNALEVGGRYLEGVPHPGLDIRING